LAHWCGTAQVELGACHGDWTPWNMNIHNGRVQVWDWEKFTVGVPVGFDAAHCFVQRGVVWQARRPVDVFAELIERAEPVQRAHGLSLPAAQLTCWLYALGLAVSYLEDDETQVGASPLIRLDGWLPQTLERAAVRTEWVGANS
jgi:aminoglycoside phosphotransferase (APT) family kinase protein